MKKLKILLFLVLVLITQNMMFASNGDLVVYITKTGSKYHLETCRSLRSSKIPTSLQEAVSNGLGPCSICNPQVLGAKPVMKAANTQTVLYRVNKENLSSYKEADLSKMVVATVIRTVDGDTIQVDIINPPDDLQNSETVRLIGVDTPETVHPSKPVEHFGKEASEFTKSRLEGKTVYLAFDWDTRDFYQRLLAYVYLEDGTCLNAAIIDEGYGFAYLTYAFQFTEEFADIQREAREQGRGLWKK